MSGHEPRHGSSGDADSDGPTTEELWDLVVERTGLDRVEILVDLSMRTENSDMGTALALAEEAVSEARAALGDDHLVAALLHHGRLLVGERRFVESAATYLEAATLSSHGSDAVQTGHSYLMAGDALDLADDIEGAVAALRTAESAFLCEEEWVGAGYAAQRAGRALWVEARHEEALEWLDRARPHFQRSGQAEQVLETDHLRASVLRDLQRYDEAIAILTSCLAVSTTVRPQAAGSLEHFRLGRVYRSARQFRLAIEHLTRAHAHAVSHSHIHDVGQCLRELAMCHFYMDPADDTEALLLLAQARAHYDLSGCSDCVIECDVERAEWLVILDRFEEAAAINRSLALASTPTIVDEARLRLADNLLHLGRCAEALAELPGDEDPEHPRTDRVRELQLRASALFGLNRREEALVVAEKGLALVDDTTDPAVRAPLLAVRSELRDDASSLNDRAQAIAYYLAAGEFDVAQQLSQAFMPAPRPERSDPDHGSCAGPTSSALVPETDSASDGAIRES